MSEDWRAAWQPVIDCIGEDFGGGAVLRGADEIDRSAIRRLLEPIEFDCPLHYDEAVAQRHGHPGILAPLSSLLAFTLPPIWEPGTTVFTSAERDAQLPDRVLRGAMGRPLPAPPTTGFFATDIEIEYFRPFGVGDRLTRRGRKLLSCLPKETGVGRGAFVTFESEVVDERGQLVAKIRTGTYSYNPHPKP